MMIKHKQAFLLSFVQEGRLGTSQLVGTSANIRTLCDPVAKRMWRRFILFAKTVPDSSRYNSHRWKDILNNGKS